jgi:uncharacterized protein
MTSCVDGSTATPVRPISQFVLKVHSKCDLACDHCYVYEHADQSWRRKPVMIEPRVTRQAAVRIAEHAATRSLPAVQVILHGGEPLLLGAQRLRQVLAELKAHISPVARLDLHIHTNGVRLTTELCDLFAEYGVRVGVSLDGDRTANDRHRRFANGKSSHKQVQDALKLLRTPAYQRLYSGILCTVDISNDPIDVLEALLAESPPRIDFLLPHATWDHPPPRPEARPTAYADWLGRIFDHWAGLGRPVPIRLFDSIEAVAAGGSSQSEGIGLDPVDLLVIETNGEWEQVDSLKTAYDGAPATGLDVFAHSADQAAAHPAVAARQDGAAALSAICLDCPVLERCGGGLYSHRYQTGRGFDNPSVYCDDLKSLIYHVGVPSSARGAAFGTAVPGAVVLGTVVLATVAAESSELTAQDLDAIADRPASRELVSHLAAVQLKNTRTLFTLIGDGELVSACWGSSVRCAADAWSLIRELDRKAPASVRTVFEHPFARAWAARLLESKTPCGNACGPESAHLAGFAIAAAIRAGVAAELSIPLLDGVAHLPTLGACDMGAPNARTAVISTKDGAWEIRADGIVKRGRYGDPSAADPNWQTPHRTSTGGEVDGTDVNGLGDGFLLDDLDPFRDCYGWEVSPRLPDDAAATWIIMLPAAVKALDEWSPEYAEQVRTSVRTVVPLIAEAAGAERSATSRHAFGSIAAALPEHPRALAMLLVHESQHLLLDTVFDMYDLSDETDTRTFTVGWRSDPRPIPAVLHGIFAHIGMAEVWSARRRDPLDKAADAHATARKYAQWAQDALDELTGCGALTPVGERFAERLSIRLRGRRDG